MNNKTLLGIFLIMGLILTCYVAIGKDIVSVDKDKISIIEEEYISSYKTKYVPIVLSKDQIVCSDEPANKSCTTEKVFYNSTVADGVEPVYSKKTVGYEVNSVTINKYIPGKGCLKCPTDESVMVCYPFDDGFAENMDDKYKCECKSGSENCQKIDFTKNTINAKGEIDKYLQSKLLSIKDVAVAKI